MFRKSALLFLLLSAWLRLSAQSVFTVLPLGVKGGLDESNLSAYLVSSVGSSNFICLDAGTVYSGLTVARKKGSIQKIEQAFLKENGIQTPKISLLMRRQKHGKGMVQDLVFNIDARNFKDEQQYQRVVQKLAWYVPKHYTFITTTDKRFTGE